MVRQEAELRGQVDQLRCPGMQSFDGFGDLALQGDAALPGGRLTGGG
jgi:hypothetical protein